MEKLEMERLKELIRSIPDFPEKGVMFRDITTALKDKQGLHAIIDDFTNRYMDKGIDYVLGADARGFIVGADIEESKWVGVLAA